MSKFWPLGEGFRGVGPQVRLQHAELSPETNSEVMWLELKGFPQCRLVTFQWPDLKHFVTNFADFLQLGFLICVLRFSKVLEGSKRSGRLVGFFSPKDHPYRPSWCRVMAKKQKKFTTITFGLRGSLAILRFHWFSLVVLGFSVVFLGFRGDPGDLTSHRTAPYSTTRGPPFETFSRPVLPLASLSRASGVSRYTTSRSPHSSPAQGSHGKTQRKQRQIENNLENLQLFLARGRLRSIFSC